MGEPNGASIVWGCTIFEPRKKFPLVKANDDATIGQLRGCFLEVLGRMVDDKDTQAKIDAQSLDYEALRGDAFSNKMAKQNLESMSPRKYCFLL